MPTNNPRLMVVISRDQDELLEELGALQGRSKASYLRELLDGAEPMLRSLVPQLKALLATVEGQPVAVRDVVKRTLTEAYSEAGEPLLDALIDAADKAEAAEEAKKGAPSEARVHRSPNRRIAPTRRRKAKSAE